ncbi:hypothetical protein GLW07_21850 [Bacillus hwajinpoensis]|uniref:HTH cro/C1-type domain-containing protein n=1 Tax=Guptibacillus hwajinpoensis TaxID=208199 RepID=A0A845F5N7_9BACL|nr:helix-turn-helix transcriptional regulator [Pseudalkalibacillus hwajinpoensis]MYL65986.1 hypothetical protein [Pseudalkalibacillus hwajinpoensis]
MIKNQIQYDLTKSQLHKFEHALTSLRDSERDNTIHELLWKAQIDALESQVEELTNQIKEYESYINQEVDPGNFSLDDLPTLIIAKRLMLGLTEEMLADKLDIPEAEIIKYEEEDYSTVSYGMLVNLIKILEIDQDNKDFEVLIHLNPDEIFRKLHRVGFTKQFILQKLISFKNKSSSSLSIINLLSSIKKIFNIAPKDIEMGSQLQLNFVDYSPLYKLPENASEDKVKMYTTYALYIAKIISKSIVEINMNTLPDYPELMSTEIKNEYGEVNFENTLYYAWSKGVAVVPLNDPGGFHGAFWRIQNRNIIFLKQKSQYESRWLFDLLHELWHAAQEQEKEERFKIDVESMIDGDSQVNYDKEEKVANIFAWEVIFEGKAEELAKKCAEKADNFGPKLKSTLIEVATENGVKVDYLANYLAYRADVNLWGVAANLQSKDIDPYEVAKDILFEKLDYSKLEIEEIELLDNLFED